MLTLNTCVVHLRATPIDEHCKPYLPIGQCADQIADLELLRSVDTSLFGSRILLHSVSQELLLLVRQPFRSFRRVGQEKEDGKSTCYSEGALKNEDPTPAGYVGNAIPFCNGVRKKSGERSSERGGTVVDRDSGLHFEAAIPCTDQIRCRWKETCTVKVVRTANVLM